MKKEIKKNLEEKTEENFWFEQKFKWLSKQPIGSHGDPKDADVPEHLYTVPLRYGGVSPNKIPKKIGIPLRYQ